MTLTQILRTLRARYRIVLLLLIVTMIGALLVSLVMPKTYKATVSMVLNNKGIDPVTGINLPAQLMAGYLPTQVDIVNSKVVALKVVDNLKLADIPKFQEAFAKADHGQETIRDWLADGLSSNLSVEPARESSVLDITFKGHNAEYVAQVANAFAAAYQEVSVQLKVTPSLKAADYINDQIKLLRQKFEDAQNKMSVYQKEHNIFSDDNKLDVETARLNELSSQLVAAQGASMEATSRQRQVKTNAGISPDVLNNPLIQSLKSRLADAEAKFANASQNLGVNHPEYIAAKSEVDKLRASLNQQIGLASGGIVSNAHILQQHEAEISAALTAQKAKVLALNSARDELSVLNNEAENAKKAYETASQRLTQTTLESQSTQSDISVLTAAVIPSHPASPRLFLNMLVAIVVGGILGVIAAIVMELLDQRIRSVEDLTLLFGLPLIGVIEKTKKVQNRTVARIGPGPLAPA